MSRHRLTEIGDDVAVDDAPTGPITLPAQRRITLVPRKPADMIPPAAPPSPPDEPAGAPGAITPADRARAWADAPGEFARPVVPRPARPVEPPRLIPPGPADGWGPWPSDPAVARPRSAPLPVLAPAPRARRSANALLIATIVLLIAMLAVLGVALVRPDLLGLSGRPLVGDTSQVAPG